ncbi:MAG TPA: hypothetical protein VN029_12265 [Sphingomonas sp.]|nr:hypothetical protein [Sphingomonas sp.]
MVVLWACGALLAATSCHAQAVDERSFAAGMIAQIRQRAPGVEVVPQDDPLSVSVKGGGWKEEATLNFHRVYGYCLNAAPADCKATRDEFLDKILAHPVPPAMTPASLRLAVRDAQYVAYIRGMEKKGEQLVLAEPIGEDLFAILVSDSADAIAVVTPEKLAELGMTRAQAWRRGWAQTRAALPALPDGTALAKSAVAYQEQGYLASLLIDTRAWQAIAEKAGPELFVIVVSDNFVFVGGMANGPELERFKQTVREDCASQPRCISPNLYRFRDGRWVVSR